MSEQFNSSDSVIRIEPRRGWMALNLRELWQYRDLIYFFAWRDLKVRYRQTLLGFAWAVINPVVNTIIFTIIFGAVAGIPTDGLPYPVFYLIGLVFWRYFSSSLTDISASLVKNAPMLTKIYFPRLLVPINACLIGLAEFGIAIVLMIGAMIYYRIPPAATSLLLPALVLLTMVCALGIGLFFSALNVRYRDFAQLVPFLIQIWMYGSVVIPFSQLPARWGFWRYLYGLNPMAGIIEAARWCLAHDVMTAGPPWGLLEMGLPFLIGSLLFGLYYFKRVENLFADII